MTRFTSALLQEIRARLPVSRVVSRKVPLKRAGREFKGLSPFKQERMPSFTVNDHKGFYHCFASGEHGDIFTFVILTEGLSFPQAVRKLAAEASVPLSKIEGGAISEPDSQLPKLAGGKYACSAEHEQSDSAERLRVARFLWSRRRPLIGTVAERYLREARGYHGPLPATLGYLPGRDKHPPAVIAAFAIATETEPGTLSVAEDTIRGVHLTRLNPDGSGKAGTERDKFMLGLPSGNPIVLAPANDLLGLAITEGIEDALSVHAATGLGVWAAGSAGHMPHLAAVVPNWIECATIYSHADPAGRRGADGLARGLHERGFEVFLKCLRLPRG